MFRLLFFQEEGLSEVQALVDGEEGAAERHLRNVLDELNTGCARYISITKGAGSGPGLGKTKLDKERMKLCQRDVVSSFCHCTLSRFPELIQLNF